MVRSPGSKRSLSILQSLAIPVDRYPTPFPLPLFDYFRGIPTHPEESAVSRPRSCVKSLVQGLDAKSTLLGRPGIRSLIYRSEEHTSELQSHSDLVCRL